MCVQSAGPRSYDNHDDGDDDEADDDGDGDDDGHDHHLGTVSSVTRGQDDEEEERNLGTTEVQIKVCKSC